MLSCLILLWVEISVNAQAAFQTRSGCWRPVFSTLTFNARVASPPAPLILVLAGCQVGPRSWHTPVGSVALSEWNGDCVGADGRIPVNGRFQFPKGM